jgi:DNA-binding NarL/FixJ family response regulator
LLIDVIQTVLSSRLGMAIVAEIDEIERVPADLPNIAPDVVIVGPAADSGQLNALVRTLLPSARVLTVSADLLQLLGPGEDDVTELTLGNLTQRLRS